MKGKWFIAALLAAAGVFVGSGSSRGGDTIRLNRVDSAPVLNLVGDGQGADTIRTWHRGFGWGGYRGFGWGGYRGLGWGGYRGCWGYRNFGWGGFYRPYYGFGLGYGGFYRPYYGLGWGGFYRPYIGLGYGGFYPGFGYGFYGPCAGATANVYTLNMPATTVVAPLPAQPRTTELAPSMPPSDGTFPYDGGPADPLPNPKVVPPSSAPQPRTLPLEGRSVSLPKASSKWTYPAYGETARRTVPASDRTYLTRSPAK